MNIVRILLSPPLIGIVAVFLSVVWMLRDEKDRTRPALVIALVLNLFYGLVLNLLIGRENGLVPWKYDHVLARIDDAIGLSAATIASPLQAAGWRIPLLVIYQLLVPMMITWYMVSRYQREPDQWCWRTSQKCLRGLCYTASCRPVAQYTHFVQTGLDRRPCKQKW